MKQLGMIYLSRDLFFRSWLIFIELELNQRNTTRHTRRRTSDTNDLIDYILASLGTTLDEVYQRLVAGNFGLEDPELAMFTVAILMEGKLMLVLMLAFGASATAERGRNRLMRW